METTNDKIRNKLTPIKVLIDLIERYENASSSEDKKQALDCIISMKQSLKFSMKELIKINN